MKLESKMILKRRIPGINLKLLFSSTIVTSDHYRTLGDFQFRRKMYSHKIVITGIPQSASEAEVDAAYFKKLSELKPMPGMMKEDIESVLVAYETLSDRDSRVKYDQSLSSNSASDEVEEIIRMSQHQPILDQRAPFVNQGVRKKAGLNETLDEKMFTWSFRVIWSLFLIVTVPKVAYIAYQYIVNGVSPV